MGKIVRPGRCITCGQSRRGGRGARECDACLDRHAASLRARRAERKVSGHCTRCAALLPEAHEAVLCVPCNDYNSARVSKSRKRRRRTDEAWRQKQIQTARDFRSRRKAEGGCCECTEDAVPGLTRCERHHLEQRERNRLNLLAKAAKRRRHSTWDASLTQLERAAPCHLEEGVQACDLLQRLENDAGPLGPTRSARERKLYRLIAELIREGRMVKVDIAFDGRMTGYRRPEPRRRRMRQTVTVTAATTVKRQPRAKPALRINLIASQTATVAADDTRAA